MVLVISRSISDSSLNTHPAFCNTSLLSPPSAPTATSTIHILCLGLPFLCSSGNCRYLLYFYWRFALIFICCRYVISQAQRFFFSVFSSSTRSVLLEVVIFAKTNSKSQIKFTFPFLNSYIRIHFVPLCNFELAHISLLVPLPSPLMSFFVVSNSLCWQFFSILLQCSLHSHDNHQTTDTFHFQSVL